MEGRSARRDGLCAGAEMLSGSRAKNLSSIGDKMRHVQVLEVHRSKHSNPFPFFSKLCTSIMLSLRMLGRVAPRVSLRAAPVRSISSLSRNTALRPTFKSVQKLSYPVFSTSSIRRDPAGECKFCKKGAAQDILMSLQRIRCFQKSSTTRDN